MANKNIVRASQGRAPRSTNKTVSASTSSSSARTSKASTGSGQNLTTDTSKLSSSKGKSPSNPGVNRDARTIFRSGSSPNARAPYQGKPFKTTTFFDPKKIGVNYWFIGDDFIVE